MNAHLPFTTTKIYHLLICMMMPELEDINFTATALLGYQASQCVL